MLPNDDNYAELKIRSLLNSLVTCDIYQDITKFFLEISSSVLKDVHNTNSISLGDGKEYLMVAPYLKRYLKEHKEIYYWNDKFLVWGRNSGINIFNDPILEIIVTERMLRRSRTYDK